MPPPPRCCPTCRLLAPTPDYCLHCGDETVPLAKLARPRISGVTAITKQPPKGWRDALALITTSFGIFGGAIAGAWYLGPAGLLVGPGIGALGYTKQFWRTAFTRRDRVMPIDAPRPPDGDRLVGIAQPHERTLELADAAPRPLVVAFTVGLDGGVIARRIEAVPFWLVLPDKRRILIDGELWLDPPIPEHLPTPSSALELAAGIPLTRKERRRLTLQRIVLAAGDHFSALGTIAPEQLLGSGYRDHLIDAMRGQPRQPVWLAKIDLLASPDD